MSYLTEKFKGIYRILPEFDVEMCDVPRNSDGSIMDGFEDEYIYCQYGNKIYYYGHGIFVAYIPSLIRGHRIIQQLNELQIPYTNYMENDSEIEFRFKVKDMETVATLLKARTSGANISPYSTRNLPKSDVKIPIDKIKEYKAVIAQIPKDDMLLIKNWTNDFLTSQMTKKYKHIDGKDFDIRIDMRKNKMGRQKKEYIFVRGEFDNYLNFLEKKIGEHYGKNQN